MSRLVALCGICRSGKSTFARSWQDEADPDGFIRVVVNGDNVRTALHGMRYVHSAEPIVHGIYSTMIRALLLNPRLKILLDDTHTTVNSIRQVLLMDTDAEFIYIPCDVQVAKNRAVETGQQDLFPVIDRMYRNLVNLSNDGAKHPQLCSSDPIEENIVATIEKIRDEVKRIKEYSDRSV